MCGGMRLKESCPYKRSSSLESGRNSQYQTQEGVRRRGWVGAAVREEGVPRRECSPSMDYPPQTPSILPPLSRQRAMYRETPKNRGAGGREGGWVRGEGSPALPYLPQGTESWKGASKHLSSNTGPPTLGERDMAFPRVSFPPPHGSRDREGAGAGCAAG